MLLLWWSSPAYSLGVLMGSNLSAGDRNFAGLVGASEPKTGFEVWLHDYFQINVQLLSEPEPEPVAGKPNSLEFCVSSNHDSRPVHVAISIDTRILNYENRSVSKYSFYMGASHGWRNSRDYFDYMINSENNCTRLNKIKLGYMVDSPDQKKLDQMDFIDTIMLTVRPE
jgi:hypothetical protein